MSDRPPFDFEDPDAPDRRPRQAGRRGAHFRTGPDDPDASGPLPDDDLLDDVDRDDDAYEYIGRPRGRTGGSRALRVVLALGVMLVLVGAVVGIWAQRQIDPPGEPGAVRTVAIPEGSTSDDIGSLLADEGIISNATVWRWYLRIAGGGPFQAGMYDLAEDSAMGDVVAVLDGGPKPPEERSVTIPEGLTQDEIVARLADPELGLGFDAATMQSLLDSGQVRSEFQPPDQPSNEGILFPETYRVAADADELSVLRQMVAQLDATLLQLDVASAQERFNLTPYEILIVASLIEEETKVDSERPMVARVIYNRMRQRIPLGIDATSRYEAEIEGRDRGSIDFTSDSPYNTRRTQGLPPTPIASPGRASIEAALNPADGPWVYYVLQDAQGNHLFTESYDEFLEGKARCAAEGLGCG